MRAFLQARPGTNRPGRVATQTSQMFIAGSSWRHCLLRDYAKLSIDPLPTRKRRQPSTVVGGKRKRASLPALRWNSYGTEGAQPLANVRGAESAKQLESARDRCRPLPPLAVWIA